tara:strand:+ start:654 stop:2006 length:1353 start_codon:yes stop_codon:yes gene_type:complete
MNSYIQLINHASVLFGDQDNAILSDPWYSGTAFDDGWSLLYENKRDDIINILKKTTHIWISHEHPDHFSIKFFNEYYEFIKDKIFLFQETKDKRVLKFLKAKNLNVIEIKNGEKFQINTNFEIQVEKCDFYDSALIINLNGKKIFNINDCPLKDKYEISEFRKKYGNCDILLTQFSYAAWKGGKKNINWRKQAAKEKMDTLNLQADIFNAKVTIPFASFIYFSNNFNFYLNDSMNQPKKISDEFFDKNKKLLFLEPYQKIDLEKLDNIKNNYNFWQNKFSNISKKNIVPIASEINYESLEQSFNIYHERLMKKNSKVMLKILRFIPFISIFDPIVINLIDLKTNIYIDITSCIFKKTTHDAEISMHSKSMNLIFKQDFGFDTLTVNGCFEELKTNGFLKLAKNFSIGNLNNLGIGLNFKSIFNINIFFLFLKKLFFVKKKLNYKLIEEFE